MAMHTIQAQKTFWVQTEIEAETEAEALEIAQGHFAVQWSEFDENRQEFSGVFFTDKMGLVNDPITKIDKLEKTLLKITGLIYEMENN
jgi:hypothetical protein